MAKSVTTIPATLSRFTAAPINSTKKRRVAAYARVSTDNEEQLTSYEAQVDYYTNYIQGRDDWEFAGVYTDEGITGTNTKKREGFKSMVADALAGKIDLIITKSVSRFARNTVDSLTTIRSLKEHNVECYFEKENIWPSMARASCCSRSCPHWHRRSPDPFPRTAHGASGSVLQTARSLFRSIGFWATTWGLTTTSW